MSRSKAGTVIIKFFDYVISPVTIFVVLPFVLVFALMDPPNRLRTYWSNVRCMLDWETFALADTFERILKFKHEEKDD